MVKRLQQLYRKKREIKTKKHLIKLGVIKNLSNIITSYT
jgi:hypothetical protein